MGYYTIEWLEDVDLSGGSAAVALGLAAGRRGPYRIGGVDTAIAPENNGQGVKIRSLWACNETVHNSPCTFTVGSRDRGTIYLGGINARGGGDPAAVEKLLGIDYPVPAGAALDHLGFDGGGAEQSAGVLLIDDPNYPDLWNLQSKQWDDVISVTMTTAARVANTISGHTDICGRTTAYTNAETPIPADPNIQIQVIHVTSNDVAGYSGPCLVATEGQGANLMLPTPATLPTNWDMYEILGGYPTCTADKPFNVAGVGVGVAAQTLSAWTLGVTNMRR